MSTNATIQPVTSLIDPNAQLDEVSFKCFIKCPTNTDCAQLNGTVIWLSSNSEIARTEVLYNRTTQELFSFLNESVWSSYMNQNQSCKILIEHIQTRPMFDIISTEHYAGIECEMPNSSDKDKAVILNSIKKNHKPIFLLFLFDSLQVKIIYN